MRKQRLNFQFCQREFQIKFWLVLLSNKWKNVNINFYLEMWWKKWGYKSTKNFRRQIEKCNCETFWIIFYGKKVKCLIHFLKGNQLLQKSFEFGLHKCFAAAATIIHHNLTFRSKKASIKVPNKISGNFPSDLEKWQLKGNQDKLDSREWIIMGKKIENLWEQIFPLTMSDVLLK